MEDKSVIRDEPVVVHGFEDGTPCTVRVLSIVETDAWSVKADEVRRAEIRVHHATNTQDIERVRECKRHLELALVDAVCGYSPDLPRERLCAEMTFNELLGAFRRLEVATDPFVGIQKEKMELLKKIPAALLTNSITDTQRSKSS